MILAAIMITILQNIYPLIQDGNDDRFDILTNKNSKFIFHNFDSHLNSENKPGQPVRNM